MRLSAQCRSSVPASSTLSTPMAPRWSTTGYRQEFDSYVASTTRQLNAVGSASPRYHAPRHGHPAVDGTSLARCNADRLLGRLVGPALAELGAPAFATSELKTLGQAAGNIPSTTN